MLNCTCHRIALPRLNPHSPLCPCHQVACTDPSPRIFIVSTCCVSGQPVLCTTVKRSQHSGCQAKDWSEAGGIIGQLYSDTPIVSRRLGSATHLTIQANAPILGNWHTDPGFSELPDFPLWVQSIRTENTTDKKSTAGCKRTKKQGNLLPRHPTAVSSDSFTTDQVHDTSEFHEEVPCPI